MIKIGRWKKGSCKEVKKYWLKFKHEIWKHNNSNLQMFFIIFCHILRDIFEEILYHYSVKEHSCQVWQVLQFHFISLLSIKFTKFKYFKYKMARIMWWHCYRIMSVYLSYPKSYSYMCVKMSRNALYQIRTLVISRKWNIGWSVVFFVVFCTARFFK